MDKVQENSLRCYIKISFKNFEHWERYTDNYALDLADLKPSIPILNFSAYLILL
jgi:hypothetical protein